MGDGAAALRGMGREELERRSVRGEVTGNAFVAPAKPGQTVRGMPAPQGADACGQGTAVAPKFQRTADYRAIRRAIGAMCRITEGMLD